MSDADTSFLSRWSRRKAAVREGKAVPDEAQAPAALPQPPAVPPPEVAPAPAPTPMPTLADVAQLRPGDNIARFVAQGVDESVKRAALKTLFADPHFNVMDGLDTYIDDYSKPDPIPLEVLRKLRQSETLGLFASEPKAGEEEDEAKRLALALEQKPQADEQADDKADEEAKEAPTLSSESADDPAADKHA